MSKYQCPECGLHCMDADHAHEHLTDEVSKQIATIARLTAENAKLREALRYIEVLTTREGDSIAGAAHAIARDARRALADADTGEGRGGGRDEHRS